MPNYYNAGAALQGINTVLGPLMQQRMQEEALRKQLKLKQQMDLGNALRQMDMQKQMALQNQAGLTQAHTQARQMMSPLQGLPPINQMGSNVYAGQGFPIPPSQTGGIYPNMPAGFQPKSYNPFATKPEDILSLERMPLPEPPDYLGQRKKLADIAKTEVETEKIRKEQPSVAEGGKTVPRPEDLTAKFNKYAGIYDPIEVWNHVFEGGAIPKTKLKTTAPPLSFKDWLEKTQAATDKPEDMKKAMADYLDFTKGYENLLNPTPSQSSEKTEFNSEAEANASNLPKGTVITIKGRKAVIE